ncbi:MAG: sporulation protein YunB [Bacillota bacterium]|nr:sporulation protein YunB [Bacillota bacterium]
MYLRRGAFVFVGIGLIIVIVLIVTMDFKLKSSVLEIAQSKAQLKTVEMITGVVNDKVVVDTEYQNIICIHKDDQGRIVMVQPNTVELNRLMARTVGEVAHLLGEMEGETIGIPLGQLTGSEILAGYGPKVMVKIIPAGQVFVNVENKFEEAGINQSRHLIYLTINSSIKIAVPFMDRQINVSNTIPLAETIIVGTVPETYVHFTGSSDELYPLIRKQ